jgi:membrane-associated phospholipid phosphatase
MWGAVGMMLPMNKVSEIGSLLIPTAIVIVIAGMVMSARLALNAHTPREILIGSTSGFAIGFFGMIILF